MIYHPQLLLTPLWSDLLEDGEINFPFSVSGWSAMGTLLSSFNCRVQKYISLLEKDSHPIHLLPPLQARFFSCGKEDSQRLKHLCITEHTLGVTMGSLQQGRIFPVVKETDPFVLGELQNTSTCRDECSQKYQKAT